nr:hypothetical protein [Tanacetum cinerariifolium]
LGDLSSWDLDKATWGGRVDAIGTVPVCCRCTGECVERDGFLAGKSGTGTVWVVISHSFELLIWIPATCQSQMLPLCFPTKGIRLILPNSCVRWLSVCTWCRPIRKEGCATWDGGNSTWEGRVRVFGTVPVVLTGASVGEW